MNYSSMVDFFYTVYIINYIFKAVLKNNYTFCGSNDFPGFETLSGLQISESDHFSSFPSSDFRKYFREIVNKFV